jgi:hypothetical protein
VAKAKGFNKYKTKRNKTEIYLERRNGDIFITIIDTEDLQRLIDLNYCWHVKFNKYTRSFYANTTIYYTDTYGKRKSTTVDMNNLLMNAKTGEVADHINRDTLDNRKMNLRIVDRIKNAINRKGKNINNKSGYRNVFWSTKDERWMVTLMINGKSKCFGRFKCEDLDKAGELAEQMRKMVEELAIPHAYSLISEYTTISIGVNTIIPSNETSIEEFIRIADKALYKAKKYRNIVVA